MPVVLNFLSWWSGTPGSNFEVRIDPTEITALAADSGCVLQIPINVQPDGLSGGPCLLSLHGTLRLGTDGGSHGGIEVPMQSLAPNYRYLRVPVGEVDIFRIEARRAAADLTCHLTLGGIANVAYAPPHGSQAPLQALTAVAVHDNGGVTFVIAREQWLRMLAQAGHAKTRLVELPALAGPSGKEWGACVHLMEQATAQIRRGEGEPAIATCRKVLEGLVTVIARRWGVDHKTGQSMDSWLKEIAGRLAQAWPQDADAARVVTGLYAALWSWTSESHHYGSKVPLHEEAAFAVGLTAQLLVHAGQLLAAHPEQLNPATTAPTAANVSASS